MRSISMKLFIYISLFLMLVSCTTSGRRSGSLSDAMDKASDRYEDERTIAAVKEPEQVEEENQSRDFISFEEKNEYGSTDISSTEDLSFGVQGGSGVLSSDSFYGITSFSLAIEQFYTEKRSAFIELGGFYSPLQTAESDEFDPDDEIVKALKGGIFSLFAGIRLRYYTTPRHTLMGNYFGFGFGVHSMFWNYKNELEINEYDESGSFTGTETINGDQLWGVDLNGSAGLNLVQAENFVLGIEFNPGVIIWWYETYEGFTNDVFEPFLYFKTSFNLMFK